MTDSNVRKETPEDEEFVGPEVTEEEFICDECGAVLNSQHDLHEHFRTVHGKG